MLLWHGQHALMPCAAAVPKHPACVSPGRATLGPIARFTSSEADAAYLTGVVPASRFAHQSFALSGEEANDHAARHWFDDYRVFALDVAIPLGHIAWSLYLLPLWLSSSLASPVAPRRYASLSTVLLGSALSGAGRCRVRTALFNRVLGVGLMWAERFSCLDVAMPKRHCVPPIAAWRYEWRADTEFDERQ